MMKKTCLCIFGLLLMGMLCVPVAATTQRPGYWNFDIVNDVLPSADMLLDNKDDNADAIYQRVYVTDDNDWIELQVKVTAGPDTTLTIKKDYITTLRNKCQEDWEPALVADGGFLTYDVDAVCIDTNTTVPSGASVAIKGKVYEHLKKRGLLHAQIGSTLYYQDFTHVVERHVCRKHHLCS